MNPIIENVMSEIKGIIEEQEQDYKACSECGSGGYVVSFSVKFQDDTRIGGEDLEIIDGNYSYNNLFDIYSINEDILQLIINRYPEADLISFGLFCDGCLKSY